MAASSALVAVLGLAVVVLLGLILFASRPASSSGRLSVGSPAVGSVTILILVVIVLVAAAIMLALITYGLLPGRRRKKRDDDPPPLVHEEPPVPWAAKLLAILLPILLIAGLFALLFLLPDLASSPAHHSVAPPSIRPSAPIGRPGPASGSHGASSATDWLRPALIGIAMIATIATVGVGVWLFRGHSAGKEYATTRLTRDLVTALDDTLDDLLAEQDPRRAVIRTYAKMEHILAAHGMPRRAVDAPMEYMARVLRDLDVSSGSVRTLTDLFELAKFSQHVVDAPMKQEAIVALSTVRDELREAA